MDIYRARAPPLYFASSDVSNELQLSGLQRSL